MSDEVARQRDLIRWEREELGRTVQALADKVDVQARAKEAVASAKMWVRAGRGRRDVLWGVTCAGATVGVLLLVWRGVRRIRGGHSR